MRVQITETVLRDANQSLIATRMPKDRFADILSALDAAGYHSLECWGGATFDTCLRYLQEDPWERLRFIRSKVKNTKLQMLLRGQNLLGYKHYPDDIVRRFVAASVRNGIDIIRIFDALNDMRNMEVAVDETLKQGAHAQGTICYTISPIHNLDVYVQVAKDIQSMGCNSICIKDMAGIISPKEVYDLVSALKQNVSLPIVVHTHSTTGMAPMVYLQAVQAGAACVDCAISSFSGGTSQPATETMNYVLKQYGYDTGLQDTQLKQVNDHFKVLKDEYISSGLLDAFVLGTETDALIYQIPGGMLSNLISQLKASNAMDKLEDVLQETPRVRKDLGYPPLVTPMSQIVGSQATTNVMLGERYKTISKEAISYVRGEYGRSPGPIDPDLLKKVLGDEPPFTGRFADTLEPYYEQAKQEIGSLAQSEEDVLSYVAFPQIARKFLTEREERRAVRATYTIRRVEE